MAPVDRSFEYELDQGDHVFVTLKVELLGLGIVEAQDVD